MGNQCVRPLAVLALILCLGSLGQSQEPDNTIKGELHSDTPLIYPDYLVELVDVFHRAPSERVDIHGDGAFMFRRVAAGEYLISVTDTFGHIIHEERLSVHTQTTVVTIRLKSEEKRRTLGGTVSVKQLLHPPSRKAVQSFADAQRFSESGDYAKAAATLERAVQDSPGFSDAHTNLGAQYMRMGRAEEGLAEFRRALEISGGNPMLYANVGAAQLRLRRFDEAAQSARAALRLDSDFLQAHLILGVVMAIDPASRAQAILHLRRAADTYPSARTILEQLGVN